ncbi:Gsf2p [Saccharomyces cerevisiae YJM987]|nr:Gsf2p [Saccharomyces cerevisiae YJM993]AJS74516.1 Gsf2p [Saccharomyces cerevisiae YJM984]AJS74940.1 Gsf2p [Saccharomyces cerevisiae YJM987]AJS75821.1 Gsf2p [Saccharomyces cerevisiae YJM996]CAI4707754.1 AGA_1a_G0041840.mRNA.1.CDS.1 [Saccharomyces cerevisiae]
MEIYIRLNADVEHDYAFQVSNEDTINNKIKKIFPSKTGLADLMVLRPSIFHEKEPVKFYKSIHPGYLSEGGCLMFHYEADNEENLEELNDSKPLIDQLWPGQLVVPEWKLSKKNIWVYTIIMLAWLYTDLPDAISPTPGICLTNQLSRLLIPVAKHMDLPEIAAKLEQEVQANYSSLVAQWLFFVMHIFKVGIITLFLKLGIANPISFNPYKLWSLRDLTSPSANGAKNSGGNNNTTDLKTRLRSLGWIGAKRATYDDYQTNYYNYVIDKMGGAVAAYRAGAIRKAAAPGIQLVAGEGFQSPLEDRFTASTFTAIKTERKFILSEEYFVELENNLKKILEEYDGDIGKMNAEIRRFRRFGIYEPDEKLASLVNLRREIADEKEKASNSDATFGIKKNDLKKSN